ncbi:hypothetical protein BKA70DRAFT_1469505 [Coprinopsis sp. MPI-PUGE-AT-0042]|nr:hypothetical protein BKA70DRAFT_1469505 [Coprinopsis sp. MPI-PUGE-AT-0042]
MSKSPNGISATTQVTIRTRNRETGGAMSGSSRQSTPTASQTAKAKVTRGSKTAAERQKEDEEAIQSTSDAMDRFRKEGWFTEEEGEEVITFDVVTRVIQTLALHRNVSKEVRRDLHAVALLIGEARRKETASWVRGLIGEGIEEMKGEVKAALEEAKTELKETAKGAVEAVEEAGKANAAGKGGSYAQVAAKGRKEDGGSTRRDREIAARLERKERQVLVDGLTNGDGASTLSERELVSKANIALDLMKAEENGLPEGARFVAAMKKKDGAVVYEMDNAAASAWLAKRGNGEALAANFGGEVKVKGQGFKLEVAHVPTAYNGNMMKLMETLEKENGMPSGILSGAKWRRNPKYWKADQETAHLDIVLANAENANKLIDTGLTLGEAKLGVKKPPPQPRRCQDCQIMGMAACLPRSCKETKPVCGNCAAEHHTRDCRVTDARKYECVNCRKAKRPHDHAAWSYLCPSYANEQRAMVARQPELGFKYYPTEERDTWVEWASAQENRRSERSRRGAHRLPAAGQARAQDKGYGGQTGGSWADEVEVAIRKTQGDRKREAKKRKEGMTQEEGEVVEEEEVEANLDWARYTPGSQRGTQSRLEQYWATPRETVSRGGDDRGSTQ